MSEYVKIYHTAGLENLNLLDGLLSKDEAGLPNRFCLLGNKISWGIDELWPPEHTQANVAVAERCCLKIITVR